MTRMLLQRSLRPLLHRKIRSYIPRLSHPPDYKFAPDLSPPTLKQQFRQLLDPNLDYNIFRFIECIQPAAWSDSELSAVLRKINDQGPQLMVSARATAAPQSLNYHDPFVVTVSYHCGFDRVPKHLHGSRVSRAAGIARATMIYRQQVKQGLIKPKTFKGKPWCTDTYHRMFDCCRVPNEGLDWSVSYATPCDLGNSGHIIVLRKNRVWKVEVTQNGRILSTQEIEKQIQHIYDNTSEEYPAVGVMTTSNRNAWPKDYLELRSKPHNRHILDAIHSSAFIICLDSSHRENFIHHSRALRHGDVIVGMPVGFRNRWADKPLQFIVFDDAYGGMMGEHYVTDDTTARMYDTYTGRMDGTAIARIFDDVFDKLYDPTFDHSTPSGEPIPLPQPLDWEISPEITRAITNADHTARALVEGQALGFYLASYGRADIEKFSVHPVSWAEMIILLAYKRLLENYKRIDATYEFAPTTIYKAFKGRSNAIRLVASEALADWAISMDNNKFMARSRKRLFNLATLPTQPSNGFGAIFPGEIIDRHLIDLKNVLKEGEELPELYNDPVFKRWLYWFQVSTSEMFSIYYRMYGWGKILPDGFGVAYMTGYDGRLQFTVTSCKEMHNVNACLVEEIAKAADDLYALHKRVANTKVLFQRPIVDPPTDGSQAESCWYDLFLNELAEGDGKKN